MAKEDIRHGKRMDRLDKQQSLRSQLKNKIKRSENINKRAATRHYKDKDIYSSQRPRAVKFRLATTLAKNRATGEKMGKSRDELGALRKQKTSIPHEFPMKLKVWSPKTIGQKVRKQMQNEARLKTWKIGKKTVLKGDHSLGGTDRGAVQGTQPLPKDVNLTSIERLGGSTRHRSISGPSAWSKGKRENLYKRITRAALKRKNWGQNKKTTRWYRDDKGK